MSARLEPGEWTGRTGTWSAANGYVSDTTALGQNDAFWRAQTNGDTDLRFSYRDTRSSTGSENLQVRVRASRRRTVSGVPCGS